MSKLWSLERDNVVENNIVDIFLMRQVKPRSNISLTILQIYESQNVKSWQAIIKKFLSCHVYLIKVIQIFVC